MPNFKRIGGGPWKNGQKSVDLTWNDPEVNISTKTFEQNGAKITFRIYKRLRWAGGACLKVYACVNVKMAH